MGLVGVLTGLDAYYAVVHSVVSVQGNQALENNGPDQNELGLDWDSRCKIVILSRNISYIFYNVHA